MNCQDCERRYVKSEQPGNPGRNSRSMEDGALTRYLHRWRIAGLFGFTSVALALSAGPASATVVCPPGTSNPAYCHNVPPIATTTAATHVGGFSATVNGVAGPGVKHGDITQYYFQYGTRTSYDFTTATGVIGSCPPGVTNPAYCKVPDTKSVSARLSRLTPNTLYHYRIVAVNPDGTTKG